MAIKEKKITDLEELQGIENDALLYVIQGGEDKKITAEKFLKEVNKGVGQLSNQIADQGKQINDLKDSGVAVSYDPETKTLNISSGVGGVTPSTIEEAASKYDVQKIVLNGVELDLAQYVKTSNIMLGKHTDGLIYLFVNGEPVGTGMDINGSVEIYDVSGNVSEDNTITLNGNLADGIYILKYLDADGDTTEIGQLKVGTAIVYTNLFDPSAATLNARWSNSSYSMKTENGYVATDYIPAHIEAGTLMHIRGASFNANSAYVTFYDSTKQIVRSAVETATTGVGLGCQVATVGTDDNGDTTVDLSKKNNTLDTAFMSAAYIRVCLQVKSTAITASDIEGVIITIDEMIEG